MSEVPRYPSLPATQEVIYDGGAPVGYRIAIRLQKGDHIHEETEDVIVGAEQAALLAVASDEEYTAWNKAQMDAHNLVGRANAALDAIE